MKPRPILFSLIALLGMIFLISSCKDIMEPSISKRTVFLEAPGDQSQSTSYTVNFWWDQVEDALTYHLQVVTPAFNNASSLVLDTIVKSNKFVVNLKPGDYQWRVQAQNGSSQTQFSEPKSFTLLLSSIKGQSVQLKSPANNLVTNQNGAVFSWGNLYGATKYHIEIDTNNFANESALVYDQSIPGQQLNFTFPKDQIYQWRVRAENDTAKADWSTINAVTYDHTPPGPVVTAAPGNNQQVILPVSIQWNTVVSASKYKLYVFKSDSTTSYSATFPVVLTTNSYNFSSGTIGERIYWKVAAVDAAGNEGSASVLRSFVLR